MYVETYIHEVIRSRSGFFFLKIALHALSVCYRLGVWFRHLAFNKKWVKQSRATIPVVSIGNIVAGGTGKTAFVKKVSEDLCSNGKIFILSRAYRSLVEKRRESLYLNAKSKVTPEICGDEVYMLLKSLQGVDFLIGRDRVVGMKQALQKGADLIVLDDGMQYRRLHRDIEVVMLHADNLFGKGYFLPRGYLRDSPKRLEKADFLVVHHIKEKTQFQNIQKEVAKYSQAPIIGTKMGSLYVLLSKGRKLHSLQGKRVGVFCGLGSPSSFIQTTKEMGADVIKTMILPDHIAPSRKKLNMFSKLCKEKGCELIICSEKDRVKLQPDTTLCLPIGELKAQLEVVMGQEIYSTLLSKIKDRMKSNETMD